MSDNFYESWIMKQKCAVTQIKKSVTAKHLPLQLHGVQLSVEIEPSFFFLLSTKIIPSLGRIKNLNGPHTALRPQFALA